MAVSYGGVELLAPLPYVEDMVAARINVGAIRHFIHQSGHGFPDEQWAAFQSTETLILNRLRWPVGASRWAMGHYIADGTMLASIRELALAGDVVNPLDLAITHLDADGDEVGIETEMFMLPPRPLFQTDTEAENCYILTLVDERYYWWRAITNFTIGASWEDVYADIGTALGITIDVDTIPAEYLTPPTEMATWWTYWPQMLDAVAASVGQKLVRQLDGTILAQNAASASTSVAAQKDTFTKEGGGTFWLANA